MKRNLWEILVPANWNTGEEITIYYHQEWDQKVREIAKGLTLMKAVKGQWIDPESEDVYHDVMIPVRVYCTKKEMNKIIRMTLEHYHDQKAIMAYKISNECIVKYRG